MSHGFTTKQMEELREYFDLIGGNLRIEEVRKVMLAVKGTTDTETVAAQMAKLAIFDINADGFIGYKEFLEIIGE